MIGKSIRLFLADGAAHGLIIAEIVNWTGRVLSVSRADMDKLAGREEARRPGVYLLAGDDPDKPSKDRVYVGESENVFKRLLEHHRRGEKEFWTKTALILSKDENLTKSHVRYLESRIIKEVRLAGRFILDNNTEPDVPAMPEADIADMEFFLEQLRMLLPVLSFNVMQRLEKSDLPDVGMPQDRNTPEFEMAVLGIPASMRIVGDEYVVLKGAMARKAARKSWTSYRSLRDQLVEDGILVDSPDPEFYRFEQDYAFASPSAAAAVIVAGNQNGHLAWKHRQTGQTYKDWQEERLAAAGVDGNLPE